MNDHGFVVCAYNRTVAKVDHFLANEAKGQCVTVRACTSEAGTPRLWLHWQKCASYIPFSLACAANNVIVYTHTHAYIHTCIYTTHMHTCTHAHPLPYTHTGTKIIGAKSIQEMVSKLKKPRRYQSNTLLPKLHAN